MLALTTRCTGAALAAAAGALTASALLGPPVAHANPYDWSGAQAEGNPQR